MKTAKPKNKTSKVETQVYRIPEYFVTRGENGWAIIYNWMPLCATKETYAEVLEVAKQLKHAKASRLELHVDYYDGKTNSWKPRSTL